MDTTLLNTLCPPAVRTLIRTFRAHGANAYPVGGCVRDALMGVPPHDWDVAVTTPPDVTEAICAAAGWRTIPTGEKHGTVTVLLPGENGKLYEPVECTTCRTEGGYSDGRHPDAVAFTGLLSDDLSRRDFTINAMAADYSAADISAADYSASDLSAADLSAADLSSPGTFTVIDLFGGRDDLAAGVIRCVGDPARRLTEDALRILRAVRFAARLGFAVHPDTEAALRATAPGLARISRERVRTELLRILCGPAPLCGVTMLENFGLMPYVLPAGLAADEPARLPGGPGNLSVLPPEDIPRLACLLAGMCPGEARQNLDSLRLPNETVRGVLTVLDGLSFLRAEAARRPAADPLPLLARRLRQRTGALAALTADVLAARGEGVPGLGEAVAASEARGECVTLSALAVTGKDLAAVGVPSGKPTGECLTRLLEIVIADPAKNSRELLLKAAAGGAE